MLEERGANLTKDSVQVLQSRHARGQVGGFRFDVRGLSRETAAVHGQAQLDRQHGLPAIQELSKGRGVLSPCGHQAGAATAI
jgi:hypothetical protein